MHKRLIGLALFAVAGTAHAALPGPPLSELQVLLAADSGDTAWLLVAAFALFACALTALIQRAPPASPTRTATGLMALVGVVWVLFGYSIAFAPGGPVLGGPGALGLAGLTDVRVDTAVPESAFVLWEFAVALFAAAIALAALPRSIRTGWALGVATAWLVLAWLPAAHWLRGGGWLMERGVLDAGGALSVHLVLGVSALVLTRFADGRRLIVGTSAAAGAALAGSLALVAGSALTASDDAATLILTALAGGAAGALVWLLAGVASLELATADLRLGTTSGVVAVSAGAGSMGMVGALALGALASAAVLMALRMIPRVSGGVAIATVHGGAAALGALLAPLMVAPVLGGPGFVPGGAGLAYLLGVQSVAVLVVVVWTAVATGIAGLVVSAVASPLLSRRESELVAITPPPGFDRPVDAPMV